MSSEKKETDMLDKQPNDQNIENSSKNEVQTSQKDENSSEIPNKSEEKELSAEEKIKIELDEKIKEIVSLKDKILRTQAQAVNDRKRFKSEADRSAFESKKRFLKRFLDIRDNIDRALTAFDPNDEQQKSHAEGIKLIGDQFEDVFSFEGIQLMSVKGEMYDILKHEVVSRIPYNGPENRVIDVIQNGYMMNDKVLRVSKVVLSMKEPKPDKKAEETGEKTSEETGEKTSEETGEKTSEETGEKTSEKIDNTENNEISSKEVRSENN